MRGKDEPKEPHVSYQKNKKKVQDYSDPTKLADHVAKHTQGMAKNLPDTTQGMITSLMSGQQFLQSKLPQSGASLPLSVEHKPSRTAMSKFNSYYDTVNDPMSVLSHVKAGTLKNEHLEALGAVYPKLYEEMKKKVVEHMDPEKAKGLPYGTKVALAKFMGQPMDASMLPQSIMANQAALAGPRLGSQASMDMGKPTLGGMKELNASDRTATKTQLEDDDSGKGIN